MELSSEKEHGEDASPPDKEGRQLTCDQNGKRVDVDDVAAVSAENPQTDTDASEIDLRKCVDTAAGESCADVAAGEREPAAILGTDAVLSISKGHSGAVGAENLETIASGSEDVGFDNTESKVSGTDVDRATLCPAMEALFRREKDISTERTGGKGELIDADGHWSNWKPIGDSSKRQNGREVNSGNSWNEQDWWRDYIHVKDSTLRIELSGTDVGDNDLPALFRHVDSMLQAQLEKRGTKDKVLLNIDLSCNDHISDHGVVDHLAPFLERWPACARLKLYKTAIGDKAIESLTPWISQGYAHELHLSDLRGRVSGEAVFRLLMQVHECCNYPYSNDYGSKCALWLRLEYNGIRSPEKITSRAKEGGMSVCMIEKTDLHHVRPGTSATKKSQKSTPEVHLVLFQMQELRQRLGATRQGNTSAEDDSTWNGDGSSAWNKAEEAAWNAGDSSWKADESAWNASDRNAADPRWSASGGQYRDADWRYGETEWRDRGRERGWADPAGYAENYDRDGRYGQGPAQTASKRVPQLSTAEKKKQLTTALELVEAIDPRVREGDREVMGRWHDHLKRAAEPGTEASRIMKMVGKLCNQGYNSCGSYSGVVTTPSATSHSMPANPPAGQSPGGFRPLPATTGPPRSSAVPVEAEGSGPQLGSTGPPQPSAASSSAASVEAGGSGPPLASTGPPQPSAASSSAASVEAGGDDKPKKKGKNKMAKGPAADSPSDSVPVCATSEDAPAEAQPPAAEDHPADPERLLAETGDNAETTTDLLAVPGPGSAAGGEAEESEERSPLVDASEAG